MIIIGENINATHKKVSEALQARDEIFFRELAQQQAEAGASVIDCNTGAQPATEEEDMIWTIGIIQDAVNIPIAVDSANPAVLRAGLEAYRGDQRLMINSINFEQGRFERVLPLVKEFHTQVVALVMSEQGMPRTKDDRVNTARRLIDALTQAGVAPEDIFVDPIVTPIGADATFGRQILDAISEIKEYSPQGHVTCGLSNVSYGLPQRRLVNRTFLAMAMARGLDSAIVNPLDSQLMASVCAAEALLGQDEFCLNYIGASRAGKLD